MDKYFVPMDCPYKLHYSKNFVRFDAKLVKYPRLMAFYEKAAEKELGLRKSLFGQIKYNIVCSWRLGFNKVSEEFEKEFEQYEDENRMTKEMFLIDVKYGLACLSLIPLVPIMLILMILGFIVGRIRKKCVKEEEVK